MLGQLLLLELCMWVQQLLLLLLLLLLLWVLALGVQEPAAGTPSAGTTLPCIADVCRKHDRCYVSLMPLLMFMSAST
jgi:hypothetical protein